MSGETPPKLVYEKKLLRIVQSKSQDYVKESESALLSPLGYSCSIMFPVPGSIPNNLVTMSFIASHVSLEKKNIVLYGLKIRCIQVQHFAPSAAR